MKNPRSEKSGSRLHRSRFINNKIVQSTSPRLLYDEQLHSIFILSSLVVRAVVLVPPLRFFLECLFHFDWQLKLSMRLKTVLAARESFLQFFVLACCCENGIEDSLFVRSSLELEAISRAAKLNRRKNFRHYSPRTWKTSPPEPGGGATRPFAWRLFMCSHGKLIYIKVNAV